jgi:endonuclease/exonuclease/phosphatase family metal-dependent hydrolase
MCAFKVLQFNIQFGQNWNEGNPDRGPINLDVTAAEILAQDADIVLLQEVEQARSGGTQINPPPNYMYLRKSLPDYHGYFSYPRADPRELPFGIGLAILSKAPLRDIMRRDLPSPAVAFDFQGEQRTPTDRLLIGAKTTMGGQELQLFNTHLLAFFMLKARSEEHIAQRQFVVDELRLSLGPTLLGGDFNVSKHDSLVEQCNSVGYQTVQTKEATWRRRPYVLDHLFFNRHLRPVHYAVRPTLASDHHVLVADFEYADAKAPGRGTPSPQP